MPTMQELELVAEVKSLLPGQTLTDEEIIVAYNETDSFNAMMAVLWRRIASRQAGLVDVQEGSSSRKLSQLYTQALVMAERYEAADTVTDQPVTRPGRTRRIVRSAGE